MSYISMTDYDTSDDSVKKEYDDQIAKNGRITNMKRTLLHSVPAFTAYMEWYTLRDLVVPFIGERGVSLYCFAISNGNNCSLCSLFFRKILVDSGENPDDPRLTDKERLLMDFGREIAVNPQHIPEKIYMQIHEQYNEQQIVLLIAFAGIMSATNLFNSVAKIPIDEILYAYQKENTPIENS
jgi:hypothetical protein